MKDRSTKVTLLDWASVDPGLRPVCLATWQQRYNAHRYIFDTEASRRVGQMLRDCMDLLVDNIEFARTPFPTAFFQLDSLAMWEGWRPEQPRDPTADQKVGFLLHNGQVIVLASGPLYMTTSNGLVARTTQQAKVCGMSFRINRPQWVPYSKLTNLPEHLADLTKQGYVFGGQREYLVSDFNRDPSITERIDDRTKVRLPTLHGVWTHSQIAAHFDVMPAYSDFKPSETVKLSFLGGGDPLILTTMLLLLNQPSKYVALTHAARERGLWKGKLFSFKEHHVVTLKLDREQHVRDIFHTTDRATPIQHEVGGHWKHYNKGHNCNHHHSDDRQAWEPVGPERTNAGDFKRYWCPLCLQRRTWVETFQRGTGGLATTEYHVTR